MAAKKKSELSTSQINRKSINVSPLPSFTSAVVELHQLHLNFFFVFLFTSQFHVIILWLKRLKLHTLQMQGIERRLKSVGRRGWFFIHCHVHVKLIYVTNFYEAKFEEFLQCLRSNGAATEDFYLAI